MTTSLTHSSIFFLFFFCINPPSMISGLKAVAWRGKIVVTGGWNGTRRLDSCYSHDPAHKGWHRLGNMNTARSNHSLTVVADQLVVAGGYDGTSSTDVRPGVEHLAGGESAGRPALRPGQLFCSVVRAGEAAAGAAGEPGQMAGQAAAAGGQQPRAARWQQQKPRRKGGTGDGRLV